MIDVHYVATPNGVKVLIMLLETGLDHRLVPYKIIEGDHLTPEFRKINPNARLPAIVDHDPIGGGEPLNLFESGAILIYLAEKSGQFLPSDPRRRAEAIQWTIWQMAGLGPMHGQAHHFIRYAPEPVPYALNRYFNEAQRLLSVMDSVLAERDYLAGEYSIADMACWPWVRAARVIDIDIADYPALTRWFDRVGERSAVQNGAAGPSESAQFRPGERHIALSEEQWSNLFGNKMLEASGLAGDKIRRD